MGNYIRSFGEMTKGDFQTAGGKAANLGELTQNGFNVPMGFCVTSNSLSYLVEENHLQEKIDSIIATFTFENLKDSEEKSAKIRDLIIQAEIPSDLLQEIHVTVLKGHFLANTKFYISPHKLQWRYTNVVERSPTNQSFHTSD